MSTMYLGFAIATEIVGTSLLKVSDGFSNLWVTAVSLLAYGLSFYFLSLALRTIPIGVAYAIWSAIGIIVISIIGWFAFEQKLSGLALAGIGVVIVGVVLLQLGVQGEST
jgi:small multidrug resistance pump